MADADAQVWARRFAERIGVAPLSPEEFETVLDLAGVAAHASARQAAPVCCWLAATAGLDPAAALAAAEELATETGGESGA